MSSSKSTAQDSNNKISQSKGTQPPDGISGQYRNANLPQPMHAEGFMFVLSYKGYAWPKSGPYDGIIGVYTHLDKAMEAGNCWLMETPGSYSDLLNSVQIRCKGWKELRVNEHWEMEKGLSGEGFLESRVVSIERFDVQTGSPLPKEREGDVREREKRDEDDGGKNEEDGKDDRGNGGKGKNGEKGGKGKKGENGGKGEKGGKAGKAGKDQKDQKNQQNQKNHKAAEQDDVKEPSRGSATEEMKRLAI